MITIGIILSIVLYFILSDKIKIFFGYKKYEYTKILSYGMLNKYEWHKTDEKALESYNHFEFVSVIKPYNKRLRPL